MNEESKFVWADDSIFSVCKPRYAKVSILIIREVFSSWDQWTCYSCLLHSMTNLGMSFSSE
jgi:hypothetical protein